MTRMCGTRALVSPGSSDSHSSTGIVVSVQSSRGMRVKWRAQRRSQTAKSTSVNATCSTTRWSDASAYSSCASGQSSSGCGFASTEKREARSGPAVGS